MLYETSSIDQELIDLVTLKGASCNIYLKPDHQNESRAKSHEYIENYALPNFLVQKNKIVAFTDGHHLPDASGYFETRRSYYAYSNANDLFINFLPKVDAGKLPVVDAHMMSLSRYAEKKWILNKRYELLYDGLDCMEAKGDIIAAIKEGKSFRLSLLNEENNWFVTNVDLPFYVLSENKFQFQTNIHWYPNFFELLEPTEKEMVNKGFPKENDPASQSFAFDIECPAKSTYLSVFSGGTYQNTEHLMQGRIGHYNRMILFCG